MLKKLTSRTVNNYFSPAFLLLGGTLLLASCSKNLNDEAAPTPSAVSSNDSDPNANDQQQYQKLVNTWLPVVQSGRAGGSSTTKDFTASAFDQTAPGFDAQAQAAHQTGDAAFNRVFSLAKLAPIWVNQSCQSCHLGGGRAAISKDGVTPQLLFRVSQPGQASTGGPSPLPVFGLQIQPVALGPDSTRVESFKGKVTTTYVEQLKALADGTTVSLRQPTYTFSVPLPAGALFSPRTGSQMAGLSLLEAVPEQTILQIAQMQANALSFGITGKPNYVWDPVAQTTKLGRFGWKANQPSLVAQIAGAYNGDLGITSTLFPIEPDGSATVGGGVDVSDNERTSVMMYARTQGVPALRNTNDPLVQAGRLLFMNARCAVCHTPVLRTGDVAGVPQLSNQTITPFTDLLLHDMGPGLADNRPDFLASGSEWRTPPLWGMGLSQITSGHTNLLHDGRARNAMEAIMWHDGEAAYSRQQVEQMSKAQRDQLVAFLNSL
ncbi:di-heme oxidoredictase family protein [Hymenobacter baengnokdamensis]|uniref:di-heme oxidoredictase family protein n=1 Tax=Hymenobacter baengnokdamensis TaxID=2615203 RepID=UPI0012473283|nr:di-heme oxidoredictase family protein [Hymenobacter baengnokdamensis]